MKPAACGKAVRLSCSRPRLKNQYKSCLLPALRGSPAALVSPAYCLYPKAEGNYLKLPAPQPKARLIKWEEWRFWPRECQACPLNACLPSAVCFSFTHLQVIHCSKNKRISKRELVLIRKTGAVFFCILQDMPKRRLLLYCASALSAPFGRFSGSLSRKFFAFKTSLSPVAARNGAKPFKQY